MPDPKQEFIQAVLSADTKLKQYERKMEVVKEDADFTDALLQKFREDEVRGEEGSKPGVVLPSDYKPTSPYPAPPDPPPQPNVRTYESTEGSRRTFPFPEAPPPPPPPAGAPIPDDEVRAWIDSLDPRGKEALRAVIGQFKHQGTKHNVK